jgi:RND family efflux transporter MFP subunit
MNAPSDLSALRIDRTPPPSRPGAARALVVAVVLVLAALAAVLGRGCFAARAVEVQVGLASATGGGNVTGEGITANGYVVARTKASVSSKILGRLSWVGVSEGSVVKAGEVLARLEDADVEAAVNAARANAHSVEAQLTQAKRELERTQVLRRQSLLSDAQLENAQTAVDVLAAQLGSARAQAALAEANLENTRVRAPFSGTVLRKDAEVGEIVAPSSAGGGLTRTAIVTMADLRTLEVEVDVNEAYIAQVRGGQDARITLDAYPDTSFTGRVRQVVPTADRQKATVLVKVSILDHDPRILPEMGAKVVFENKGATHATAIRRVLAPAAAVVQDAGGASVWVVETDRVRRVRVDVGGARGDQVEIRQGLAGGESLVLQPPGALRDGDRVRVAGH